MKSRLLELKRPPRSHEWRASALGSQPASSLSYEDGADTYRKGVASRPSRAAVGRTGRAASSPAC